MSRVTDLISSLAGDPVAKLVTALASPAKNDSSKLLATTEWFFNQFLGSDKVSLGTNGYIILPNLLIIQWGQVEKPTTAASLQISYPIPFPTGPYTCIAGFGGTAAPNGSGVSAALTSSSKVTFFTSSGASGMYINWVAFGH